METKDINEDNAQGGSFVPQARKVIVVLENASLEAARLNSFRHDSKMQLLNCDEHQSILKRLGRDIADARPDIVHQVDEKELCGFMCSLLARVSVNTTRQSVEQVGSFGVQLLERGSISGDSEGHKKLLEILPGPVTQYFPSNVRKFAMSWNAPRVRLYRHFKNLPEDQTIVVAVGAMAKGPDSFADSYVDEKIGISQYALSAAVACGKVCCALEDLWDVM
ncbi:hypothetical protein DFQ28_009069 [Apophysomyces sp. BC1034]|nr:hypothetical protein DFQ29_010074 [Apophysomyces sp. BC1021]KAG0192458.1 hypothetical protein DFQ28_009069 [Apophysomyces sp. BC1034]